MPRWAQCHCCPPRVVSGWQWCCWWGVTGGFCCQNTHEEPIHILNIALRWADHVEDEKLVPIFRAFAQSKVCCWGWPPFLQTLQAGAPYPEALPHLYAVFPETLHTAAAPWVLFAPSVERFALL